MQDHKASSPKDANGANDNLAVRKERDYAEIRCELECWFQSALGRALLASQRKTIDAATRGFFGFHQAEIGVSHRTPVGNLTNLGNKFFVANQWVEGLPENCIVSPHDELALEHDVADLVIMHHALDVSPNPHQTLREASRILKPSGHLVLCGFNPLSSWGIRKMVSRAHRGPWGCRFISGSRIEDWLNLLDFKVGIANYHFYPLPFNQQALMTRFEVLDRVLNARVPMGAYYIVVAQKQVGMRIRNAYKWRKKKAKVVGLPVANRHQRDSH